MTERPDLEIIYRDPKGLRPYPKNSRTHSPEQVRQIRGSMGEFGFTNPVLLRDDGATIGAGHGRWEAALLEPAMVRVPTIILPGLTEEQWRAYIIADNKLALNAGWDPDLLAAELLDLRTSGFDLSLTGFGDDELADIFKTNVGRQDPDFVPAPAAVPATILGDVWLCGEHRIVCGDATSAAAVEAALGGLKPHLMVTDPPYGVNYAAGWRNSALHVDTNRVGAVENDDRADWREAWNFFPGEVAYVWHDGLAAGEVAASLEAVRFELRAQIIWNKPKLVPGRGHYHWKHEVLFYAVRKGGTGHWSGGRKQSTVWDIDQRAEETKTVHSTQKPVECMRRPIENNSVTGDRVYDPFLGSGSTLIAAQMTKPICHGIDIDPIYVETALDRWQSFTGEEARLESTGQTLAEVRAERLAPGPDKG